MGAGSSPAGRQPAGLDPVASPSAGGPKAPPAALWFDLATRKFVQNADGTMASIATEDQQVALALGVILGQVASVPALGNALRLLKRGDNDSVTSQAIDAVQRGLKALLDRKDISVTDLTVTLPKRGQVLVSVSYLNLRAARNAPPTTLKTVL